MKCLAEALLMSTHNMFLWRKIKKKLQKLLTFFQQKYMCELDIVLTRAVNILTANKLVKLMTL